MSDRKKVQKDYVEHFIDSDLYIPTRTIWIGPMDSEEYETNVLMAERAIKNIHILDSQSDEPITIIMINYGGEVTSGMAIYDAITICRSHVTMRVFGCANSMGSVILQAADKRLLAPSAEVMIHYGYEGHESDHPKIIERQRQRAKDFDKWMKDMYLERIREKKPRFKPSELEKMLDFNTYFTPEQAVEYGLADGVLEIYKGHKGE